ncbi:hypothetical protein [Gulosibacter sediminis]|uniref:hypothetical protein n=1 Tax=Gulosibacter sediminis TaxID=1729695 RepID=UPI0024A87476|nr:hypothetical protein [Gulosibacter sediminis]
MSFIYGGVDTETLPGVDAGVVEWPSLYGLEVDEIDSVGIFARIVGGVSRSRTQFVFEVEISGATIEEALERADVFAELVDPARGVRDLDPHGSGEWVWPDAILSGEIIWEGHGRFVKGRAIFEAAPFGKPAVDESWQRSGAGSLTFTRSMGNTSALPTVEIRGTLSAAQTVTVTVGSYTNTIRGPLTSAQVMRLDFENFEFAVWAGTTKVASLVPRMSELDPLELWTKTAYTLSVASTGTVSQVLVKANSRKQ